MGPLYFLLHIDDPCFATTSSSLDTQFADDTAACVLNITHVTVVFQNEMMTISLCLVRKKIIINYKVGRSFPNPTDIYVMLQDGLSSIERVRSILGKYFAVHIIDLTLK